jgi:hypothetical protein
MGTEIGKSKGNLFARESAFLPVNGSMWDNCPKLAILQDPSVGYRYFNHFFTYAAGDWTITTTETGGGSATEAITDDKGGVLLITNDDQDNESNEFQMKVCEAFQLLPGKPCWIEGRFKVNDATQSDFLFGLCITDTTLIDGMSDGVYFLKTDEAVDITYHCEKDSGDTTGDTGVDLADATYVRLGIYYDGAGTVEYWVNGVLRKSSTTTIPDDELLAISFAIQNGEGAAKTLSVDYIEAVQLA